MSATLPCPPLDSFLMSDLEVTCAGLKRASGRGGGGRGRAGPRKYHPSISFVVVGISQANEANPKDGSYNRASKVCRGIGESVCIISGHGGL